MSTQLSRTRARLGGAGPGSPTRSLSAVDLLVGGALAVAAVADTRSTAGLVHPVTDLLAMAAAGSLVLRGRAPLLMALVAAAGFAGYAAMPDTGTPMWSFITILVIGFSVGAQLDGRRRLGALAILVAVTYFVQVLDAHRVPGDLSWGEIYVTPPVIILAPACAGWLLQRSRRQTAALRRVTAELRAERQRHADAAAEAERSRIARELHDVISHSVSVMVVQAGAAEHTLPADSPAREQLRAVRDTGKQALAELRRQLGVLGSGGDGSAAPMPGLDQLPGLVRASGAVLVCTGTRRANPPAGLSLAVYRVVQEALTNATRYAAGSAVQVRVSSCTDGLEVEVTNGPGTPTGEQGSGRGLAGMRDRIELYGGRLEVGPGAGGWRVRAWLPLDVEAQA